MLFSIGVAGVLLRRSPLIVLLSLEIMLNASNLAFVGFSRLFGEMDGQVFALAVMAVAAVGGLRRARADRRDGAAQPRARRRQLHGAEGLVTLMAVGAWVCLLAPLAGFLAILLAGTRITRRQAGSSRPRRSSSASPARSSRSSTRWAATPTTASS